MKRWLMGIVVGLSLLLPMISGQANADLDHALATAPQGVPLDNLFSMAGSDNFTKLIDSPLVPSSVAQITVDNPDNRFVQAGAIWSKTGLARMNNQFNMNAEEHIALWLYFGNKGQEAGSGMAFVLQNSDRKSRAVAGASQSLGVWGNNRNGLGVGLVVQTAIQNSWALEFDSHVNKNDADKDTSKPTNNPSFYGKNDGFDLEKPVNSGMHIASGYPGEAETYHQFGSDNRAYFSMNHKQPKMVTNFADGQWHHLTLDWQADKKQMTYHYNDRDPVTGMARRGVDVVQDTVAVDPIKLGATAENGNVYWGITGSTSGYKSENALAMVDSSDSLGKITPHATLYNLTTKRPVPAGGRLAVGDQLRYQYQFDYDAATSNQDIQSLTMNLPLPQPLTWTAGGVSYDRDAISEPFSLAELTQPEIKKAWKETLDKSRNRVTVSATGTVPAVSHETTVPAVTARFYGPNYQTQLPLPSYRIQPGVQLKLANLGDVTQQLGHHEDATVRVQLTNNGEPFAVDELAGYRLRAKMNGQTISMTDLADQLVAGQPVGTAQLTVKSALLKPGDNQLTLQAEDKADAQVHSNEIQVNLTRGPGTLGFAEVSPQADFATTTLTGTAQHIQRKPGWRLTVLDERGPQQRWKLFVQQQTPFRTASGQLLSGHVIFMRDHEEQPVGDQSQAAVLVAEKTTASDSEQTSVSGSWQADQGPHMLVNSDTLAGKYQGVLEWRLQDAP